MNKEFRTELALQLASQLFEQSSRHKRKKAFKYYKSNNWDVTGLWEDCLRVASKMIDDGLVFANKYLEERAKGDDNGIQ